MSHSGQIICTTDPAVQQIIRRIPRGGQIACMIDSSVRQIIRRILSGSPMACMMVGKSFVAVFGCYISHISKKSGSFQYLYPMNSFILSVFKKKGTLGHLHHQYSCDRLSTIKGVTISYGTCSAAGTVILVAFCMATSSWA